MDPRIDLARVEALKGREDAAFLAARPRSAALLARARRSMPLGVPMSWMDFLFDHPPMFVDTAEGAYFTDVDGHRWLPKWQFALSSRQSITDVIRLARIATGRDRVLVFEGKYHGHLGELLAVAAGDGAAPEYLGITDADIAFASHPTFRATTSRRANATSPRSATCSASSWRPAGSGSSDGGAGRSSRSRPRTATSIDTSARSPTSCPNCWVDPPWRRSTGRRSLPLGSLHDLHVLLGALLPEPDRLLGEPEIGERLVVHHRGVLRIGRGHPLGEGLPHLR